MVKTQTLLLCIIGLTGNIAGVSSHGLPDKATAYALQARHLPAVRLGARHLAQKRLVGRSLDVGEMEDCDEGGGDQTVSVSQSAPMRGLSGSVSASGFIPAPSDSPGESDCDDDTPTATTEASRSRHSGFPAGETGDDCDEEDTHSTEASKLAPSGLPAGETGTDRDDDTHTVETANSRSSWSLIEATEDCSGSDSKPQSSGNSQPVNSNTAVVFSGSAPATETQPTEDSSGRSSNCDCSEGEDATETNPARSGSGGASYQSGPASGGQASYGITYTKESSQATERAEETRGHTSSAQTTYTAVIPDSGSSRISAGWTIVAAAAVHAIMF